MFGIVIAISVIAFAGLEKMRWDRFNRDGEELLRIRKEQQKTDVSTFEIVPENIFFQKEPDSAVYERIWAWHREMAARKAKRKK